MIRIRAALVAFSIGSAAVAASGAASAQNKPFPQNTGYKYGFLPTTLTANDAVSSYDNWKSKYLVSDCGDGYYRVDFDDPPGTTVSEGMGYGMVITAYFGDKTAFDGLWSFVQKNFNSDGLMGWNVTCDGFNEDAGGPTGSATDGDTDIGFALVAAVDQWGDEYRQPALDYLTTLKNEDFTTCSESGRNMAKAGDWGGGCDFSNTSYWMPGYYRVFSEFTGDSFWSKAADDAVALYGIAADPSTGLMANEVDQDGATYDGESYVDYNGCRIPWRAMADYLWYGTADVKVETDEITNWANSIGISSLVDGYNTDGTPSSSGQYTQQNPWVGGFACGAMSTSQTIVDAFAADFASIDDDEGSYYGSSLRTLYMLMLTGNFWKPGTTESVGVDGGPVALDGGEGGASAAADGGATSTGAGLLADGGAATETNGDVAGPGAAQSGGCGCSTGRTGDVAGVWLLAGLVALVRRRARTPARARV